MYNLTVVTHEHHMIFCHLNGIEERENEKMDKLRITVWETRVQKRFPYLCLKTK